MVDPSSLLTSVATSVQLAKGLLDVKEIANSAEAKMAIAELTTKLAEAQVQIADLRVEQLAKDEQIRGLEKKLSDRAKLIRHKEMYFEINHEGEPMGEPLCPRCLEVGEKTVHLVFQNYKYIRCPECEIIYPRDPGK